MSNFWWKVLVGAALVLIPGSLLLLPVIVAVLRRQRVVNTAVLSKAAVLSNTAALDVAPISSRLSVQAAEA